MLLDRYPAMRRVDNRSEGRRGWIYRLWPSLAPSASFGLKFAAPFPVKSEPNFILQNCVFLPRYRLPSFFHSRAPPVHAVIRGCWGNATFFLLLLTWNKSFCHDKGYSLHRGEEEGGGVDGERGKVLIWRFPGTSTDFARRPVRTPLPPSPRSLRLALQAAI